MKYRIRSKRGEDMSVVLKINRKTKKEPTPASIAATKEIQKDKVIMVKIKQSHREAKQGQTVSLRDLRK